MTKQKTINIFEYQSGYNYRAFAKATNSMVVGTCSKDGLTENKLYQYIRRYKTEKRQPSYIKKYTYMRNYQTDMTCDVVRENGEIYTNIYSLGEIILYI